VKGVTDEGREKARNTQASHLGERGASERFETVKEEHMSVCIVSD
jgi:hypothetical protein